MPTQANNYLVITDGTTTATFADGAGGLTNYAVTGDAWAPVVGVINPSEFGPPFVDVVEDIPIQITGATVAAATLNLQTLNSLITKAQRWWKGEAVNAVEIRLAMEGSTVAATATPLSAPIYGPPPGELAVQLPADFYGPVLLDNFYIVNARLRFVRRGWWTLPTSAVQSATSISQTNGDLHTLTFPDLTIYPSQTKLMVNAVRVGASVPSSYLAVSEDDLGILIVAAEGGSGSTDYTSVADSARLARNTNVLRFTPTVMTERLSSTIVIAPEADGRLFAVLANIRNNSATTSFQVRAALRNNVSVLGVRSFTLLRLIQANNTTPQWYHLGMVALGATPELIQLGITASAASGTLDIDTVVLVDLTNRSWIMEVRNDGLLTTGVGAQTYDVLIAPHGYAPYRPNVRFEDGSAQVVPLSYNGNIYLMTVASAIYAVWLGTTGSVANDRWRQAIAADALLAGTMVADRSITYLAPE